MGAMLCWFLKVLPIYNVWTKSSIFDFYYLTCMKQPMFNENTTDWKHFVDSNRRPVGLGHMQYGRIIDALRQIDYQGYLCAEAFPYPDPHEAARQTMRAFRYWTQN